MATKKPNEKKKIASAAKKVTKTKAAKDRSSQEKKMAKTTVKKSKAVPRKAAVKKGAIKNTVTQKKTITKAKPQKKEVKKAVKKTETSSKSAASKKTAAKKKDDQKTKIDTSKSSDVANISFSLDSKIKKQHDVAWRIIDGEAVIITPADSTMHTLNDVGTRIWELIGKASSLRQVAESLCSEFDVEKERAEKDTLWFAECLAKKGLVE